MTLSLIPLAAMPDQSLQVSLGGQNCTLRVYQKRTGLYVDIYVNNAPLAYGVRAFNMNKLVRNGYLGFVGDLYFYDTKGAAEPRYSLLGTRFVLLYGAP
jgi:hypothetical protein